MNMLLCLLFFMKLWVTSEQAGVCYTNVSYTYISSRTTTTSVNETVCCNDSCTEMCNRTRGLESVEYYTTSRALSEFRCCNGYYQPDLKVAECIALPTLNHTTPNATTLLLTWSPSNVTLRNGAIRSYLVIVVELETSRILQFNTTLSSLSISSLHPYYTYNCTVAAYTVSVGPYSPPYQVKMPQSAPAGPPLNVHIMNLTSRGFTCSWAPPLPEDQNGIITGYIVEISLSQGTLFRFKEVTSLVTTEDSLAPHTEYLFRVAARTVAGLGPFSQYESVSTLTSVPSFGPDILQAFRLSSDKILIKWEPILSGAIEGLFTGYYVRYRPKTDSIMEGVETLFTIISTNETQITISDLDPTLMYVVGVAAGTPAGIGVFNERVVELHENTLFQVYLQASGIICKEWLSYNTNEKKVDIISTISSNVSAFCQCSLPTSHIGDVNLLCQKNHTDWVVLSARAIGTVSLNSTDMVFQLQQWVLTSPKITTQGVQFVVLCGYPVYLDKDGSPKCILSSSPTSRQQQPSYNASIAPGTGGGNAHLMLTSVAAGIGVLALISVLVITTAMLYMRRKTRMMARDVLAVPQELPLLNTSNGLKGGLVQENQYAEIGNPDKQATSSRVITGGNSVQAVVIGTSVTNTSASGLSSLKLGSQGAHAGVRNGGELEDYVEMSGGGSVRDSICQNMTPSVPSYIASL